MNKPIIICVDDEVFILQSLKEQLKKVVGADYDLETAESAEIALDIITECNETNVDIPIIFCDQMMPGMKGDEFLIRVHETNPRTKKVILTGQATASAIGNAVNNANLYRFLGKPWDYNDLMFTVKEAAKSYFTDKSLEEKNYELERALLYNQKTGLPNLEKLNRELSLCSFTKQNRTLALLKLGTYSSTTKEFGIDIYIILLKKLIDALSMHVGNKGQLYYVYEDELAILSTLEEKELIEYLVAFRLMLKSDYFTVDGVFFQTQLSISIAIGYEQLYQKAKLALLKAEEGDSDNSKIIRFSSELISSSDIYKQNLIWGQNLHYAMQNRSIMPFFQGIMNNKTGVIHKFECLARIEKDGITYPPSRFINLAKSTGLIKMITMIMVDKSFSAFSNNNYSFSINLTEVELEYKGFPKWIQNKLSQYKISPSRVTFEILENVTLGENSGSQNTLIELKEIGCEIAIDDFGIQYSNLSRLLEIQPDYIKIDGKFIRELSSNKKAFIVTKAITELSHNIGAEVVAEFVVDKPVLDVVVSMGIEYSQGYYIMEPMSELPNNT